MDKEDRMKRIKSFKLGGHTIKVKYVKTVRDASDGSEIFGNCNPMTNEFYIATHLNGNQLAEDVIKHSLAHERVHYMLILLNLAELNSNEGFVDMMGMFLHQYDETKK
jgi:hypothetical protein